ncbi:hypothetical protein BDV97DRAFT_115219 [Delphinella strobiligena]|nr:hypothetical protein BDV97DRAFT_115219 [Delphinella strobiligena]
MASISAEPSANQPPYSTGVRFVCSSSPSLQALRSLPEPCMLVLFTPVMPPLENDSKVNGEGRDPADPFECFGQSLSQQHARVRHVPFVPIVGLTDLHLPWIRQAHAIVVIVCEPPSATCVKKANTSVENQERFMAAVPTALYSMRPSDADLVTMTSVYCGVNRASQNPDYQNIIQIPSYTEHDLECAVKLLMAR